MKKLFTLCASAMLAFTLSAQADQPQGTWYLGMGDATQLINIFSDQGVGAVSPTIGYAVKDNIVLYGGVTNANAFSDEGFDNTWTVGVQYFMDNGFIGIVEAMDATESVLDERLMSFGVGKMIMLGAITDSMYLMPTIMSDKDMNMNSGIIFGFRF